MAFRLRDRSFAPLVLAVCVLLAFVLFGPKEPVRAEPLGWLDRTTAAATAAVVRLLGVSALPDGPFVRHPGGFAVEVYYRCTGLLPALVLGASILAFPAPRGLRWKGVAVGVPLILVLNLGRLVVLFVVGVRRPEWFDFAHRTVAEAAMAAAVFVCWVAWLRWVGPRFSPRGVVG